MTQPLLFTPLQLRDVTLKNRVVIAPMHQYAAEQGYPTDWHLMNAGRWAAGGAGMVIVESTKVERRGCGTVGDLGLWHDDFIPHFKRIADFIRRYGSVPGIQIGHSGRKARRFRPWEGRSPLDQQSAIAEGVDDWDDWELVAPSAIADKGDPEPRALSRDELPALVEKWGRAAQRADAAGFDMLEIHAAHGYLLHQFLSPQANRRNDEYGGSLENRMRLAIEVTECVRANWPSHKPLFMRLSVEDNAGWTADDSVQLSRAVKPLGIDVIDCSSGGISSAVGVSSRPLDYGYQVPLAEKIRNEADIQSMAVGLIVHADHAETILQNGQADLIALAREVLHNPNWAVDAALKLGIDKPYGLMPPAYDYWLSKRAESVAGLTPSTQREAAQHEATRTAPS
jgi:2,4-dienoyl-CoA reductase-like NADH-dependent reductase (Old Yellow Enzyme family)